MVVDLQEEGTENLSLQDEEGKFLHVIPPVPSADGHEPPRCSQEETKEVELQQLVEAGSEPVQEGPMALTASDKPLTGGFQGEPNPRLVDTLCIEDSVLEANQEGTAMMVVSNSSKISHVLKSGEEIGTVRKVSVIIPST